METLGRAHEQTKNCQKGTTMETLGRAHEAARLDPRPQQLRPPNFSEVVFGMIMERAMVDSRQEGRRLNL